MPPLAAAVSNAGGLGILTAREFHQVTAIESKGSLDESLVTQPSPDDLRKAIRETRKLIQGNKPFGVNITILPAIVPPDYAGYARAAIEEGKAAHDTCPTTIPGR